MTRIKRTNPITGEVLYMDMNITYDELWQYEKGKSPEDAFLNIMAEELEFFKTGNHPDIQEPATAYQYKEYMAEEEATTNKGLD